jgi:hypothetical protein
MLADSFFAAVSPSNEPGVIFAASATEGLYMVNWPGSMAGSTVSPDRTWKQTAREEKSPGN